MPSPIAHAAAGAAVFAIWKKSGVTTPRLGGVVPVALVACVGLSLIPDLDAAVGIALGNLGRYHNNIAGTPFFGALVALVVGGIVRLVRPALATHALVLTFVCYQLHVLMDYFTFGRGLMILWPISDERFRPPFPLFYGVRWSDGVFSARHFITIFSELSLVAILFLAIRTLRGRRLGNHSPKS